MSPPVVTREDLERAWSEATGARDLREPAKWNHEIIRQFMSDAPRIASIMIAASAKRFRRKERASVATWIAALLYRSFRVSGVRLGPIENGEIIKMLTGEHEHLVRVSKLQAESMMAAESKHLSAMHNGLLLEIAMQLWGRATQQVPAQGEDPSLLVQDTYFARMHLAVVLAALNLCAQRGVRGETHQ